MPEVPTLVSAADALSGRGADVATRLPGANFLRGRRGADVATRLPGANLSRGSVGVCPAPMCAAQVGGTHRPGTVSSRDKIRRDLASPLQFSIFTPLDDLETQVISDTFLWPAIL